MGGRGSSGSGKIKGVSIEVAGMPGTLEYRLVNNKVYRLSQGGTPEEAPSIKSLDQVIRLAKQNNYKVEKYTQKDLNKMEKQRATEKEQTDKLLNNAYAKNKVGDQINKAYRNFRKAFKRR